MTTIKIALDWTPNINHIGILIAKDLGFYQKKALQLEVINPLEDNYKLTPGKKLSLGLVDFAIAPFETVISLNNKAIPSPTMAVFAILQEDISSIASLKDAEIITPKLLDGKTYASYKARYEDQIVKQMIKNDGGTGEINIVYPEKLGIWNTLLEGKADATWIFNNWEGIEAATKNIYLNKFSMGDYDIPYCYSPVIITNNERLEKNKNVYSSFIKATRKGYLYAAEYPEKAITILNNHLTAYDKEHIDIAKSLAMTAPYFGTPTSCGLMDNKRVEPFLHWLVNNKLEQKNILNQQFFTNDLIK